MVGRISYALYKSNLLKALNGVVENYMQAVPYTPVRLGNSNV